MHEKADGIPYEVALEIAKERAEQISKAEGQFEFEGGRRAR